MKRYLLLFLALTGCMVGPNYVAPEICIPEEFFSDCNCSGLVPPAAWWEQFQDPMLTCYIEKAVACNNEIKKAETNVCLAKAIRQIVASQLYPQLNVGLSASRTYFSKNGPVFAIGEGEVGTIPGLPFDLQIPQLQNIFTGLLNASWEIDLWGRLRREVQVMSALVESAKDSKDGVIVAIAAEVATNYINLRSAQQQGVLIEENISLLEQKNRVIQEQLYAGLVDKLILDQNEVELAQLRATLPPICAEIYKYIYAISVLTGELPEALFCELCPIGELPQPRCRVDCGMRSDLLRRRPDVKEAERDLAAAVASIGVAVGAFFPTLTLSADLGLQSLHLYNLFDGGSGTWQLAGGSNIPIFRGGQLVGRLRMTEAASIIAAYYYQQTILNALQEAETALITYTKEEQSVMELRKAVKKELSFDLLTRKRYESGLVAITDSLDSARGVVQTKLDLLQGETTLLLDLIFLYKAFGGGWEVF